MLELGLQTFHLRKPYQLEPELIDYLLQIPSEYHSKIVLHQHHQLVQTFNLKGIHLKSKDRNGTIQKAVSSSFHSFREVHSCNVNLDYRFLSPVFNSISKQGYSSQFSEKILRKEVPNSKSPLIALGGINLEKVDLCFEIGFSGIAVLGSIWQSNDPIEAYLRFEKKLKNKSQYDSRNA